MPKPFWSELLQPFQCLCVAGKKGMGCLNSIFKMCLDKIFAQEEKDTGGTVCEELFLVKQHPTGYIGSADDINFNTEPSF